MSFFRIQKLQERKNKILSNIKEIEDRISKETKDLDKCRMERNRYQQNTQQIQALKGRIQIAEGKIKQLEMERTSIDDIKATCTKEIKVGL